MLHFYAPKNVKKTNFSLFTLQIYSTKVLSDTQSKDNINGLTFPYYCPFNESLKYYAHGT